LLQVRNQTDSTRAGLHSAVRVLRMLPDSTGEGMCEQAALGSMANANIGSSRAACITIA